MLDYFMASKQCDGGNYVDAKLINEETKTSIYNYYRDELDQAIDDVWVQTGTYCIIYLLPNTIFSMHKYKSTEVTSDVLWAALPY